MERDSRRADALALAAAFALTTFLVHALQPACLEHWDEVQLELGMRRWDLAWHQPHPPGYVLFVLAGRAIAAMTRATHPGRVLSLLATVSWIGLVGAELRALPTAAPERRAGLRRAALVVLPLLVVVSPTLHVFASSGRTYMVEATLWVAILLLVTREERCPPMALGALVGLGGGFRPTVTVFGVVAIGAWLLLRRRSGRLRPALLAAAALSVGTAIWVTTLAMLCGGLARYRALSAPLLRDNILARSVLGPRSSVAAVRERFVAMLHGGGDALGPLAAVFVVLIVLRGKSAPQSSLRRLDPLLFGGFVSFAFYLATIYDTDGYALSFALPWLTWTMLAAVAVVEERDLAPLPIAGLSTVLLAVWMTMPGGLLTEGGVLAMRGRMRDEIDARLVALRALPPESTLIVTGSEVFAGWNFRLLMVEAPDRPLLQLARDRFLTPLTAERPYLGARALEPQALGPEGVELAALPFFTPERPLRHVVFAVPNETGKRLDGSCLAHAKRLVIRAEEAMAVLEIGAAVRVYARGGRLFCETP